MPSTMNSFLPAEVPQNSVAGQQRPQISEEEGEECEGSEQRQKKNEIIEEVMRSSQRRALEGQNSKQRCDCSRIDNEEEESWQEGDHMAEQWEEEQHLEDMVVERRMEGSSLKLDVTQKST